MSVRYRTDSSLEDETCFRNRFGRGGMCAEEAHMPGSSKECRQHAENCRRLASESSSVAGRNTFLNLADHWERLATELESAELFIRAMQDIKPPIAAE